MRWFDVHYCQDGVWRRYGQIRARTIEEAAEVLGGGFTPWPFTPGERRQLVGYVGRLLATVTDTDSRNLRAPDLVAEPSSELRSGSGSPTPYVRRSTPKGE